MNGDPGAIERTFGSDYAALAARARATGAGKIAPLSAGSLRAAASGSDADDPAAEERLARAYLGILAEDGLLRWTVPPEYSAGSSSEELPRRESGTLDARALVLIREALAWHDGLADVMFVMQGLGSFPIALAGSDEVRRRWLPDVGSGRAIAAIGITEPGAGSDLGAIAATARRIAGPGSDYRLDGTKTFISNAPIASVISVIARTGSSEEGGRGLSAFAVPADHPGVDRSGRLRTSAPHPIGQVVFSDCRVPAAWRLGEEGDGAKVALATLGRFRATVGAAAIGLASRALHEAIEHASTRVQFGRPIIEFDGLRAKIADMATDLDAARLLVWKAALALDRGERAVAASSMAKLAATEAAGRVADEAVQLHGGTGLLRGRIVERIWREVRALRIYEGTSEIQRLVIAREILEPR